MRLREVIRTSAAVTSRALLREGTGSPLVLVHGAMADARAWRGVASAVRGPRPVLLPDRRSCPSLAGEVARCSVEDAVDDLLAWISWLDAPIDLVGHSLGGLVAAEAAARGAPVRALALYEPVVWPFGSKVLPALEEATADGDLDRVVELVVTRLSGYTSGHLESLRRSSGWTRLLELALPVADELTALSARGEDLSTLADLPCRVTLVVGETSRHRAPYGPAIDRFLDVLGCDEVVLRRQDHMAHVTAPALLARTIESVASGDLPERERG